MPRSEASWLDEGLMLMEVMEFARLMLQTRMVPYQTDWDLTDELLEEMGIPFVRVPP